MSLLPAALLAGGCTFGNPRVTRMADGVESDGRFVSSLAYGAYARGAACEAAGDVNCARAAYLEAADDDPHSPEIQARLGGLACAASKARDDAESRAAHTYFARAFALDERSSAAYASAAACAAREQRAHEALELAQRAAQNDPLSVARALAVVSYAEAAAEPKTALIYLDEVVARFPASRDALYALADFALRHADLSRALRAERALGELATARNPADALQRALAAGDLERARDAARRLRLSAGALAAQALRAGAEAIGREQSELVVQADPDDADAWAAALFAADLARDLPALAYLAENAPALAEPPGETASALLAEFLGRFVGEDARAAWSKAARP